MGYFDEAWAQHFYLRSFLKHFFNEIYFHNLCGTCISWTSCSTKVSTCLIKTRWDSTGETFTISMQWMNRKRYSLTCILLMKWPSKERFCLQRILLPTKNFGFGKLLSEVCRYKYFYFLYNICTYVYTHIYCLSKTHLHLLKVVVFAVFNLLAWTSLGTKEAQVICKASHKHH